MAQGPSCSPRVRIFVNQPPNLFREYCNLKNCRVYSRSKAHSKARSKCVLRESYKISSIPGYFENPIFLETIFENCYCTQQHG